MREFITDTNTDSYVVDEDFDDYGVSRKRLKPPRGYAYDEYDDENITLWDIYNDINRSEDTFYPKSWS